jgi:hypothetical protein
MDSMQSNLSYESLAEGFMTPGESGTTFMLDYTSLQMWEYGKRETLQELPGKYTNNLLLVIAPDLF